MYVPAESNSSFLNFTYVCVPRFVQVPNPSLVLAEFTHRTGNVLGLQRVAEDNASERLNVLIFFGRTLRRVKEQEAFEANLELTTAFVELHAAYRFRRMLVELKDRADVAHALSIRLYTLLPHKVTAMPNANNGQTALAVICSEAVFPGSILSSLFHARTPQTADALPHCRDILILTPVKVVSTKNGREVRSGRL